MKFYRVTCRLLHHVEAKIMKRKGFYTVFFKQALLGIVEKSYGIFTTAKSLIEMGKKIR